MSAEFLTMNKDLQTVIDAVDDQICRHCGNERVDPPTICTECGRCTDEDGCGDSPNCTIRADDYDGLECRLDITPPPVVLGTTPAAGAAAVARNATLRITFSRPMKLATLTTAVCKLLKADGTSTGVTFDANTIAGLDGMLIELHPQTQLPALTTFKFRVTTAAADAAGNLIEEQYDSPTAFTTVA